MRDLRSLGRVAAVVAVAIATACGEQEAVLAKVGHERLRIVPFQSHISKVTGEPWQAVSAVVSSRLLDQYIDRQVFLEAARRHDVSISGDASAIEPSDLQHLLSELCGAASDPSPDMIAERVDARVKIANPAQVHVRQVLVDSFEEAVAARQRLLDGEDFVLISQQMSRAPNAADGGDLGFFAQGSLTPEIDEVLFSLAPGEFSEPVQGPSGYHVFQVLEIVPEGLPDRAAVEFEVRAELARDAERDHRRECLDRLSGEVGVEVIEAHLWFPYSGKYSGGREHA